MSKTRFETRPFVTYSHKYCFANPHPHLFGTLPCCAGLRWRGTVDARDLAFEYWMSVVSMQCKEGYESRRQQRLHSD